MSLIEKMKADLKIMENEKVFYKFIENWTILEKAFEENKTVENREKYLNELFKFRQEEARYYGYRKFIFIDEQVKSFFSKLEILRNDIKRNGNIDTTYEDMKKIIWLKLQLDEDNNEN